MLLSAFLVRGISERQALREHIAKKHNGLGLRTISMGCGALVLAISTPKEAVLQCALCDWIYGECLSVSTIAIALAGT
nr:DUF3693 domain-containing protein [Vibrio sp. V09_P4A23P171]